MRTIIISLEDAVETKLYGAELMDEQDKLILVYPAGKDQMSVSVYRTLEKLKCSVEFCEMNTNGLNDILRPYLAYFSYLAGKNENAQVIEIHTLVPEIGLLGIHSYDSFYSALGVKMNNKASSRNKEKEDTKAIKTTSRKKKELAKETTEDTVTENTVKGLIEMGKDANKVEIAPKLTNKQSKVQEHTDNDIATEDPNKGKTSSNKSSDVTPVPKKRGRKPASISNNSSIKTIEDLKAYLSTLATDSFDPSKMTMSIYESVSKAMKNKTAVEDELRNTVIIESKVKAIMDTVGEHWSVVTDGIRDILKAKEEK